MLDSPIYTGDRLDRNLVALTHAGFFTAFLSLILVAVDLIKHQPAMLIASIVTFIFGAACAYFAKVMKRRDFAILMTTTFCAIAFTVYTLTGVGNGSAVLWTFLLPVGISFFVSVKCGIILSAYYSVFFFVLFYTPLSRRMAEYYSPEFISRFPII